MGYYYLFLLWLYPPRKYLMLRFCLEREEALFPPPQKKNTDNQPSCINLSSSFGIKQAKRSSTSRVVKIQGHRFRKSLRGPKQFWPTPSPSKLNRFFWRTRKLPVASFQPILKYVLRINLKPQLDISSGFVLPNSD